MEMNTCSWVRGGRLQGQRWQSAAAGAGTRGIKWKHNVNVNNCSPSHLLQLILYPYSPRKSVEERPVGYQSPACGHTRAATSACEPAGGSQCCWHGLGFLAAATHGFVHCAPPSTTRALALLLMSGHMIPQLITAPNIIDQVTIWQ